jgi:Dolichyl-phosphate-mannose-protein mannosyltransferase
MRADRLSLAAIVVLAAALRLYGIGHDLPFVYNPDEANIMARSLSVARGLDPGYYLYPSFFFYFLFAVMGALFVAGRLVGRYPSVSAFEARFFEDPTDFYLAGRLVEVLLALSTILLLERLVSRHFGKLAGRGAAFFMAVAYVHVRDSHYLKHDVPAGFLVVVSLVAFDRAIARRDAVGYAGAGGALGISFATHYYMIFLAPAFVVCHFASRGREGLSRVLLAAAVSAATFFLLSPFVLLHLPTALEHMRANRQVVMDRSLSSGASLFPSLGLYLDFLFAQGLGVLLMALVIAGFILVALRGRRELALWASFPLFFFAFLTYTFFAGRYLNPILPSLAAAAGVALSEVARRFGSKAAVAVALVASVQPLYYSVHVDRLFARADTRTLAREWILEHVASESTVALQSYSVPLPQSAASFREGLEARGALGELEHRGKYASLLDEAAREEKAYRLFFLGNGDELNRIYVGYEELAESLAPLRVRGVSAVVLRRPPTPPPESVKAVLERVALEGKLMTRVTPFGSVPGAPYLDNEDWPPSSTLTHKGPLVELWSLETR